jgi:hypothetical protein
MQMRKNLYRGCIAGLNFKEKLHKISRFHWEGQSRDKERKDHCDAKALLKMYLGIIIIFTQLRNYKYCAYETQRGSRDRCLAFMAPC